jgi:hypothetical protein
MYGDGKKGCQGLGIITLIAGTQVTLELILL